eukprot:Skav200263  [mRNA]  locus=scaffold128:570805:572278:+ [translate_table: standard]
MVTPIVATASGGTSSAFAKWHRAEADMAVRVGTKDGMGRVVLACRSFQPGDIVMEEEPLLMWPEGDWLACARSFLALPQEKRSVILDLYHPDLESHFLDDVKVLARVIPHQMPLEVALKLFAVVKTNAHEFGGGAGRYIDMMEEVPVESSMPKRSALCQGFICFMAFPL